MANNAKNSVRMKGENIWTKENTKEKQNPDLFGIAPFVAIEQAKKSSMEYRPEADLQSQTHFMTHHMADCASYAIAFQSDVYLITIKGSIFFREGED